MSKIKSLSKIKPLSDEIIAQIAAGQVVERPASVVKELVENALDAGATRIDVAVESVGLESITVMDNGEGMSQKDVEACFLPHTTSKISSHEDLLGVRSFGFRGEALSSIASVADLQIASKQPSSSSGWRVHVSQGDVLESMPYGMPDGTHITVERLFSKVPARKKFVKAKRTESRHIMNTLISIALAHPHVSFSLQSDGVEKLRVDARDSYIDRLTSLLDARFAETAIRVEHTDHVGRVTGYIGTPAMNRSSEAHQFLSVNKRPVSNSELRKAVKKGYGTLLEPRAHPMFSLAVEYPHESVDVNVDPQKNTVRFHTDSDIDRLLEDAVRDALGVSDLDYELGVARDRDMDQSLGKNLRSKVQPWSVKDLESMEIGQVHNVYLVVEDADGIMLIDQHAAHERILYEEFKEAFEQEKMSGASYQLKTSTIVKVSARDRALLEEYTEDLENLGFVLQPFGTNEYKVDAVPETFKGRDIQELLSDMLDELAEGTETGHDNTSHRTLTYLACRSAVMAGDALTQQERKRLVRKLRECKNPHTCPHGRPIVKRFSRRELDGMFKR